MTRRGGARLVRRRKCWGCGREREVRYFRVIVIDEEGGSWRRSGLCLDCEAGTEETGASAHELLMASLDGMEERPLTEELRREFKGRCRMEYRAMIAEGALKKGTVADDAAACRKAASGFYQQGRPAAAERCLLRAEAADSVARERGR